MECDSNHNVQGTGAELTETTIYVRMSRAEVRRRLAALPRDAQKSTSVPEAAGRGAQRTIGAAFVVKSRGSADETGLRWPALSPVTVAKRLRKMHPTGDRLRPSSALSPAQRELWWNFYRSALAKYKDKAHAARVAWSQVKRRGGYGHYDKRGVGTVPILVDTEALLASFQGGEYEVFRVVPSTVTLGTDRVGALAHHRGTAKLPQRRLWPRPVNWNTAWWSSILSSTCAGVVELVKQRFR